MPEQSQTPPVTATDAVGEPTGPPTDVGSMPVGENGAEKAEEAAAPAELDIEALRARAGQAEEYLGLAQRAQADFENYRKRMTREVGAAEARGMSRLAKELLPALDNLARALAAADASDGPQHHLAEGFRLVQAELSAALARAGIQGFAPAGERFDPTRHEAIAQHPVAGTEAGTIVTVVQPGYLLNDAVLRPARVIVAG